jgi:Tol biopolymer transport system component
MKKLIFISYLLYIAVISVHAQQGDFPKLTGPYLGQKPPGMTPEVFAPGIVSVNCPLHGSPVFTPDGKELYWSAMPGDGCKQKTDEIVFMNEINGFWARPSVVSFASTFWDSDDPCISPDGKRIYFNTHRPSGIFSFDFREKIMYVEKAGDKWSSPKNVGDKINSMFRHWQMSVNRNYDLYFHAERNIDKPGIYVARYRNGKYLTPEVLPEQINSGSPSMPYISPDDDYIIFVRTTKQNGDDLFISYRDSKGNWTEAQNLGTIINSPYHDLCPNVTPDGRYLFFLSQRNGESYAYWVFAKIIEELRLKE